MRGNLKVTLGAVLAAQCAWGLNPIHESSYNLLPRGKFASSFTVDVGGITSSGSDVFEVPFSLSLEATPRLEFGAGLKTGWAGSEDHIPWIVFGAKYLARGGTTFMGDLILGANSPGKGFALGAHHRFAHARRFYTRATGKLGFMEALTDNDALMAFEAAAYPTVNIVRPLSLELGFITSSQTEDFNDNFALDMQPALLVHIGGESVVEAAATVGLAGERREDLRIKVVVIYGF